MKQTITFTLNGSKRSVDVEPADLLLDVLRDRLGIKGPKYGCGRGDCGTCTILLNGKSVRSCLMLAVEADGQKVETVEGLSARRLSPLQESFIAHSSFQCGFCAPGILMTATELLRNNPKPTREEVKEAISGNLCRCTGYEPIINAILAAAGAKK
ncbi:MAG TPA: (2Fe-2S)-binding protein [bacterium]|nr:(2Fe-2S)-binding protein [bacterium]HPQ66774.1 (2Fe-2S)-binding protein [bacterium]